MYCATCGQSLGSDWNFCINCGVEILRPTPEEKIYFNVYYQWHRNGSYTTMFGMPIVSLNDIRRLIADKNLDPDLEYYVGSYREVDCSRPHDSGRDYKVLSWRRIVNGEFGEDEGEREVFVTYLETSPRAQGVQS